MSVVVRFAPSPTGYLHIGGARTALFNWLFARSKGGTFLLRIEDTDRARSTDDAIEKIFDGLRWLGLDWDGEPVFQFARAARHAEIARKLMSEGRAYHCWSTPEELEAMRAKARAEGRQPRYDGTWRDKDPALAPAGVKPVVRLRAPQTGETTVQDMVQGEVTVPNAQLDDMVLLRGDGTPTYMLSVVVDDADMGITHVIRGDDHLTNTFRQVQLYRAMEVEPPMFGHIPLIHGPDGAKLSKRHGALGIEAYRDMGMLPEAMRNYLMRLGWSHGDADVISTEQAIQWFDMGQVGRSPARFDMQKLTSLNAHWLRERADPDLIEIVEPLLAQEGFPLDDAGRQRLLAGMAGLKARCRTLNELAEAAAFYVEPRPIRIANDAVKILDEAAKARIAKVAARLGDDAVCWDEAGLEAACRALADESGFGFGKLAQPLRVALTGSTVSPGLFEVMAVLGKDEVLARLDDAARGRNGEKKGRQ